MAVLKRVAEENPRHIREINSDIPEWLCGIIGKLHAKRPTDRIQTAVEVADLLGRHLAHVQRPGEAPMPAALVGSATTPAPAAPENAPPAWQLPKLAIGLLFAAPVLLVVGVPLLMFNIPSDPEPIWRQPPDAGLDAGITLLVLAAIAVVVASQMIVSAYAKSSPAINAAQRSRGCAIAIVLLLLALLGIVYFARRQPPADTGNASPLERRWIAAAAE